MAIGKFTTAVRAAKAIKSMLPDSFFEDMKKYVDTQVKSVIGKMNLVCSEESEEQKGRNSVVTTIIVSANEVVPA